MPEGIVTILYQYGGMWFTLVIFAIIGISAWFGKIWATLISHKEIEELKASLKKAVDENQIAYAHWYNEQAKVIQSLFSLIAVVHMATQHYYDIAVKMSKSQLEKHNLSSAFATLNMAYEEGNTYYQKNKILIPENELKGLDDFWKKTRTVCWIGLSLQNTNSEENISKGKDLLKQCSAQLNDLRHDFREILKGKIQ